MAGYALESLLAPVDGDSPAGENLEYDADFLALERLASPKAERAIGDSMIAAEEPDWSKVSDQAQALLGRSKDLRLGMHLSRAWMRMSGFPGLSSGLELVRGLLENYWDNVHPQLDAEDDNDPTARVNAMASATDLQGMLGALRNTPFVQSPRVGRFSLRDLRVANGTLKVPESADGSELPTLTLIEACCMDCTPEQLTANAAAVQASLEHAKAIDGVFTNHVGTAGPDLKPLIGDLGELKKFLDPQAARFTASENPSDAGGGNADASTGGASAKAGPGRIEGPQDVLHRLDELCEYYARNEPSSPIPLLLRRAQKLVGMSFVDILKDLTPDGINQLQVISGQSHSDE